MVNNVHEQLVLCKDDIAVCTCDYRFSNFLRCMSQSRRITQPWSFLKKPRNGKLITYNEKLVIMYLSVSK